MMFPIRNVEDLQHLNEAVSLQNQVKVVRLQDKLGKQKFHEDLKSFRTHYSITTLLKMPLKI